MEDSQLKMNESEHEIEIGDQVVDVPKGSRWLAQDENGRWVFFMRMPKPFDNEDGLGYWDSGISSWPSISTGPPEDFSEELYRLSRER